jgi:DNA primase catalytic core
MARIPEDEIERLKREVSLVRLAQARGIALRGSGDNLLGLCPFHDDRDPSLVVSPSKNVWHCLGACQAGGSVIDWVMRAESVSFRLAVEMLRTEHPSLAASSAVAVPRSALGPKLEAIAEAEEPDGVVLRRVVDYYHATLKESPEGLAYLQSRGLVHAEMVEHFRLGFANRTLGYRLPAKALKSGAAVRGQLQRLGVLRESGHEHFTGSVVVPIFGEDGAVLEMYGRKITPGLRAGTPLHMYLPGPHRGIFNASALQHTKEIILCEALIDALSFWCAGHRNVTSAYGVEGFTKELREALCGHGVERLYIAYDADDAGNKAAEKLSQELAADGIESLRVVFPKGMDVNEYALKVQPAAKALGTVLRAARWMAGPSLRVCTQGETNRLPEPSTLTAAEPPPSLAAESAESVPPLAAAVTSASSTSELATQVSEQEVTMHLGDRKWRIRGLSKSLSYESLKLNVLCSHGQAFFVDTLELYSARQRGVFLKQAADELGLEERVLKTDLGKVVLKLEELQHELIEKTLEQKKPAVEMREEDKQAALALLRDPKLCERILGDFERVGVVGEETNKLVGYLAAVSRKLDEPLAVVIQSSSAAGKSRMMEAVLSFMPEEERVHYSAMTGQSLFYMGETDLAHKILAIAEEQGAQSASYALKLLQSEGELTIASTGKDPATGRLVTHEYRVTGPVMIFLTTTAIEVDEELLNRCIVLTVDEGREQTRAIHERQRMAQTIEGLLAKQDRGRLLRLQQNAQRLLQPLFVANPFAKELRFSDHVTRTRRDHMKYLTLIRTIALLHQHQRPVRELEHDGAKLRYIEVTQDDIVLANRLAEQVLGRGLDELAPQTRRLLEHAERLVAERAKAEGIERNDVRFTQRELRMHSGWSATQVKVQLGRLQALEYVVVHYQGHRQRHLYELLTAATAAPSALCEYDANRPEKSSDRSATGPLSESPVLLKQDAQMREPVRLGKRTSQERANGASYRSGISSLAAEAASSASASTTATGS